MKHENMGTRLRVHTLAIPGLLSLAVFVVRATDRHFSHDLSWPLSLVIVGGLAMSGAAGVLNWRLREKRESAP